MTTDVDIYLDNAIALLRSDVHSAVKAAGSAEALAAVADAVKQLRKAQRALKRSAC